MSYKPLYVNTDTEEKTDNTKTDVKANYTPLYAGVEETPRIETESRIENEEKPRTSLSTTINKIAEIIDKPMSVISKPFDILLKAGTNDKKEESKFSIGGQTAPQVTTNKLPTETPTKTSTEEPKYSSKTKIIPQKERPTGLDQFGLPASTISQAKPKQEEDINFWGKVARTILPKGAEEYFGLREEKPTIKDRIQKAEDAKQSYFRSQRKEKNIASVTTEDEEYIPPTTFAEKWADLGKYGNYAKNVWNGFLKPAIGITAEQAGITTDSPKLREWGEQFTDKIFEEESRRASAKSMADVPSALEGGLLDPRYYAKTMTQAIGFMSAIFGTSVVTTAITKNPVLGSAAAFGVGATLEGSSAYKSMIDSGVSPDDANTAAQIYGTIASVIENSTGLRPAGGIKTLSKDFAVDAAKHSGIKNFFKKWAEEGILEEGSQQLVENIVTKFVDKNKGIFDDVAESMIGGMVGALPLIGGGAVVSKYQNKAEKTGQVNNAIEKQNEIIGDSTDIQEIIKNPEAVTNARDILEDSKGLTDLDSKELYRQNEIFNEFVKENATTELEVKDNNTKLAEIKLVKYPDNKWGYSYEVNAGGKSTLSPFTSNIEQTTREDAIKQANKDIAGYIAKEIETADPASQEQYSRVIDEIYKEPAPEIDSKQEQEPDFKDEPEIEIETEMEVGKEIEPDLGGEIETKKLDSLNPTGGVFANYNSQERANLPLADNITTLDKTSNSSPEATTTIYRGIPTGTQTEIVPGDFVTTNKQLAKDYAGTGNVIEKKVKMSDVLDDSSEPLGEEYIYRPQAETTKTKESKVEPRTEKENQIIKQLGEPSPTEAGCIQYFRNVLKKYPNAKPERGMNMGSKNTIQDAIYEYKRGIGAVTKLNGFNHIRADVNGKIMESDFTGRNQQPIDRKFFSEAEILKAIEQESKTKTGTETETKTETETDYRSTHKMDIKNASPVTEIKENTLNKFIDKFKQEYGTPALKSSEVKRLKEIISSEPSFYTTIYRVAPKKELNIGDWVTIDYDYAQDIKKQNGGRIHEFVVRTKELYYPNTVEEFDNLPSLNKWGTFQYNKAEAKLVKFPTYEEYFNIAGGAKGMTEGANITQDYIDGVIDNLTGRKNSGYLKPTEANIKQARELIETHSLQKEYDLKRLNQALGIKTEQISTKSKELSETLKEQIGDIFDIVEPVGNLWIPKGNTIFISLKKDKSGFSKWLGEKNFVNSVAEAGNNVYRVEMKEPKIEVKKKVETKKSDTKPISKKETEKVASVIFSRKKNIINKFKVENGKIIITDFKTRVILNTEMEDGIYKTVNNKIVKTDDKIEDVVSFDKIEDVVSFDPINAETSYNIDTKELKNFMSDASKLSRADYREEVDGIDFRQDNGSLMVTVTDSYRLNLKHIKTDVLGDKRFLLKTNKDIPKIIDLIGKNTEIQLNDNNIQFKGDNGVIIVANEDPGEYPDIKQIYNSIKKQYVVNKKELKTILEELKPLTNKQSNDIDIKFSDKEITFYVSNRAEDIEVNKSITAVSKDKNTEAGTLNDGVLVMPISGNDVQDTSVNVRYLLDMISALDSDSIYMNLSEDMRDTPILFTEKSKLKGETSAKEKTQGMGKPKGKKYIGENDQIYMPFQNKWETKMDLEAKTDKRVNKTDIVNFIEKSFKVPIKSKLTHRWKASGVYYPLQSIVRIPKWGELPVITHEIAHHIDNMYSKKLDKGWYITSKEVEKELRDLDYDQGKRRTNEGFAEYMRYRITTNKAKELAPNLDKSFNNFLKENPKLEKDLAELKNKIDIWFTQGAENRIIEHIDWKGEHSKSKGFDARKERAVKFIMEKFNDEFYTPRKITKEIETKIGRELTPKENPAELLELSKSKAGAIARTFVMQKAVDENGEVVGKGLAEILQPISKEDIQSFIAYATSKRAIDLEKRGVESGFDLEDTKFIVDKYKNKGWDSVVNDLTTWSDNLLNWVIKSGGIDQKTADLMKKMNPIYIPFKRAFLDEVSVIKGGGKYFNTKSGVNKIKGSGRPIINPIESMIAQATELISKSQKLRIVNAFVDLSTQNDLGGFISKIPAPIKATTFSGEKISREIGRTINKNILDENARKEIKDETLRSIERITGASIQDINDDILTIFSQGSKFTGKENVITVYKDGKPQFYEIHPDLYEALNGIDSMKLGPVVKILSKFSRLLRLGATGLKVSFGLARNPFRDSLSYVAFSKRNKVTIFDPIKGVYADLTAGIETPTGRFKALGGGMSGQIGFDRAATKIAYDEVLLRRLGKKGKSLYVVKHPLSAIRDIIGITEMGPRSVEMEENYKMYMSDKWRKNHPDWTEEDAFIRAFNDAQDITVNFTKSGKWAKQLNQVTAFFNASIRGPEKLVRTFKERPISTTVKSVGWLTSLALLSWFRNKDEDWYKNLDLTYKYSNLFFEIDGDVYRLPIPFELGIMFMAVPQAVMDTYKNKDTEYIMKALELLKKQIPDPTPSVFGPLLDVATNKNYLGNPIVSKGMSYKYHTERYYDWTSKLAKSLSKLADKTGVELSPIQIDYLVDNYTGGVFKQFEVSGDEKYNLPVLSDLMLNDPLYPRRQLNDFFEDYMKLQKKVNSEIDNQDENREYYKIASKKEMNKYEEIKGFYNTYRVMQVDIVDAKAEENKEKLKYIYQDLISELEYYGYD